ncbi:MAG: NAD-binding protein [Elusimicrobiota bacterium]
MSEIVEKLRAAVLGLALLLVVGTVGYVLIERWPVLDALYMTVITLGTIGYGEVHDLHTAGRIFTILLIFGGLGVAAYSFSMMTAFIVEGELSDVLRRRKMEARIRALNSHYIVCGAGFIGKTIMEELHKTNRPFVVVETDKEKVAELNERKLLVVEGDAMHEETLKRAGIDKAKGLFCALPSDQNNVFATLIARGLNQGLRIVSEVHDDSVRSMLLRGGADAVVSSENIGGMRMASEMVRPVTVGFLDSMLRDRGSSYRFEEVPLAKYAGLTGKAVGSIKSKPGEVPVVLAVKESGSGKYAINPSPEQVLAQGDVLVVLGSADELARFKESAKG